jgi:electron transfer flavoprotein alpha/beta subunit
MSASAVGSGDSSVMNIVVCLKQVLASDSRVRIQPGGAWIDEDDARWELNEPDA